MKKTKQAVALLLCIGMSFPVFAACRSGVNAKKDPKTINVQALKAGHGVDWLYEVAGKVEAAYASEGYKVNIMEPSSDMRGSVVLQEMARGYEEMGVDLYIAGNTLPDQLGADGEYGVLAENVQDIFWNQPAIGYDGKEESTTIKSKVDGYIYNAFVDSHGITYSMPYIQSVGGLVVNTKKLATYNLEIPKTTNQLFDCFEKIYLGHNGVPNSKESHVYPFTYPPGTENGYVLSFLSMNMAQYDIDEYNNFMSFTDAEGPMREDGYEVFNTPGLYEMLRVAHRLMDYEISSPGTTTQTLDGAQAQIMRDGGAVFMPNGDWFFNEVKLNFKNNLNDVTFINYPVSSALGVRLFGSGTSYNQSDAVCEEWLSYIINCADEGKTADEIVALMSSAKSATVAKADVQEVCNARAMRTMASTANTNMMITKGSDKKDIAALFCRMIASEDAAATIFATANSNSAYSSAQRENTQYSFLNGAAKIINRADAIIVDKDASGFRKTMGVTTITPLKGHLQGALSVYSVGYYKSGAITPGVSLSSYDNDAKKMQEAEYENAKANWAKWLANAGL